MPRHHEIRVMPYSADQMFALVADVRRYPEFLPWVVGMRVRQDSDTECIADMIVGFKHVRETFTSRVVKDAGRAIAIDYLDGPMKHLHNQWRFTDRAEGGCDVEFEVDFAFKNRLFEALAGQFFEKALMKMIGAFETRAAELYSKVP